MDVLRDRPVAAGFPSRRRFALSRLLAFASLRRRCARQSQTPVVAGAPHIVLVIDRDQSALEIYSVAFLHFAVFTTFIATFIPLPLPLSITLAALVEPVAAQIPCFIVGGFLMPRWAAWRKRDTIDFQDENGFVLMLLAAAVSVYLVRLQGWTRPVGLLFLGLLGLNAVASVIARAFRNAILSLEQRCVA
jgi:hypothetical protein